jgi:hypothetical protein
MLAFCIASEVLMILLIELEAMSMTALTVTIVF